MTQNIKEMIRGLEMVRPETGMVYAGLKRIETRKERIRQVKAGSFSLLTVSSSVGFFFMLLDVKTRISTNGFYEFFSLIFFAKGSPLGGYWKELSLSLAESFPVLSVTALCLLGALLIWSGLKSLGLYFSASKLTIR